MSLFAGERSIRTRDERRAALALIVTVPLTLTVVGLVFHGITPTQVALLFVGGMVFVSLARGRLLGSSIRVRADEFPEIVRVVERAARRVGVAVPHVFIRDDYNVPVNSIGLGEPYAIVLSSQYVQLFEAAELEFMIGREIGHIAAGNTRLLSLINASGRGNAIVTSLFGGWIRQTEYTADRAGLLCSSLPSAIKAIAISTFHVSGRHVEAAMMHDQRRDLESDALLRWGEVTGTMPYAVNRVRALETFAASESYRWWSAELERAPLPLRTALGPTDGPIDRRETASALRRWIAVAIDLVVLAVIFHAVVVNVNPDVDPANAAGISINGVPLDPRHWPEFVSHNVWLWYFPYAAGLVAIAGRTLGMMIVDLHVVTTDRRRLSILRALWRYALALGCTITAVPLLLSFFRRVEFHDRLSGSRLIGNRAGMR